MTKLFGSIISEAMEKVGKEGVITVEDAKSMQTTLEIVEGMQFDRGYVSPYFVTDAEKMEVHLEEPYVLLHEEKLSNMKDVLPILEKIAKMGRPILIIAESGIRRRPPSHHRSRSRRKAKEEEIRDTSNASGGRYVLGKTILPFRLAWNRSGT